MKSAFRLVALDTHALALGLKPLTALADARAMHPHLAIHDADPDGDRATRDTLVDWCRRFTPLAAPDGDDAIILDISGVAHLFGGEAALMKEVRARLAGQGFAANLAIADTPAAAWALARYGNVFCIDETLSHEAIAKLFSPMPLAALRLDERTILKLGQAGLRRIGDLLVRPRAPLAARFGRDLHHRLDALLGRIKNPISPRFEAPPFVAERRFAEGIARREDVEATILSLACDLCGLLGRHGEGARRLDVALYRVDGVVKHIEVGTSRPLRDPLAMARLFRERIEAAGEEGLETGYGFDVVRLAATSSDRLDCLQPNWTDTHNGGGDLTDLVDRLGARFGLARVTRLAIADTHQPARANRVVTAISPSVKKGKGTMRGLMEGTAGARFISPGSHGRGFYRGISSTAASTAHGEGCDLPERPLRLFDHPEPITAIAEVPDRPPVRFSWRRVTYHVAAIEGPERIAPEWWKRNQGTTTPVRDYFRAEATDGCRFWLYREGLYRETPEPRWFLHGLFA